MTETEKQVVKYDVTEAAISKMRNLYMALAVSDLEDQEGFEAVESGRKVVKGHRVATEKQRVVFKSDALTFGRLVDSEAKKVFDLLEPIETHLTKEGDKIRDEEKRIKAEEESKEKAKTQGRVDDLLKVNIVLDYFTVATMSDEDYDTFYTTSRTNYEAEQARLADEEKAKAEKEAAEKAEREAESKRLADEKVRLEKWDAEQKAKEIKLRAEQEKVRKEQEAKEAELNAAQEMIDKAKKFQQDKKDREAREKRLTEEAEARAEKEAQDRAEKIEEARIAAVDAEAARILQETLEAERLEALKPDLEKLEAYFSKLWNSHLELVPCPMSDESAEALLADFTESFYDLIKDAKHHLKEL